MPAAAVPRIALYLKADLNLETTEMCTRDVLKAIYGSAALAAATNPPAVAIQCVRGEKADTEVRNDPTLGTTRARVGPDLWASTLRWQWAPKQKLTAVRKLAAVPVNGDMASSGALAEFVGWSFPAGTRSGARILQLWGHGGASLVGLTLVPPELGGFGAGTGAMPTVLAPAYATGKPVPKVAGGRARHPFEIVHAVVDEANQALGAGPGRLTLAEVGDGLRAGLAGSRLDALLLTQCQMASFEVAYEYRDCARHLVASEELLASSQWPHAEWLEYCAAHPAAAVDDLLGALLARFKVRATTGPHAGLPTYTLSWLDLDQAAAVADRLDALVDVLEAAGDPAWRAVWASRKGLRVFGDQPAPVYTVDLPHWLERLVSNLPARSAARPAASAALDAARAMIRGNAAGQTDARGLSIYFPVSRQDADGADPRGVYWPQSGRAPRLSREHHWVRFLAAAWDARRRLGLAA